MGLRSLPTRDLIPATIRLSQFPRDPPLGGADGRRLPENRRRERSGDPVPRFVSVPPPAVRSHPIRRCHRAAGQWAGRTTRHGAAPHGHPAPPALCLKGQCLKGHIRRCGWGHCVEGGTLRGKFCSGALTYPFLFTTLPLKPSLSLSPSSKLSSLSTRVCCGWRLQLCHPRGRPLLGGRAAGGYGEASTAQTKGAWRKSGTTTWKAETRPSQWLGD